MDMTDHFLDHNRLQDPEDLDALLDLAELVRALIGGNESGQIGRILRCTMEHGCAEAFAWCMDLLQEALEDAESPLGSFEFIIGGSIPNYDAFIGRLQVDFRALNNGVETVCDHNGEVASFFNILVYQTCYRNIYLVSTENFDTRDNDYVQYKLSFVKR